MPDETLSDSNTTENSRNRAYTTMPKTTIENNDTPNTPFISVIIVNYNSSHRLAHSLRSLDTQRYRNFEVLVVDNASSDDSIALAKSACQDLRFEPQWLMASSNVGFAAGNNLAAERANGEFLAFLNPDAYAEPTWLENLVNAANQYPWADAFGSTQIDDSDPDKLDGAGDMLHAFGFPYRSNFGKSIKRLPPTYECFAPCAAAAMFRHQIFLEIGGFDERFFCYGEDVDLGFRLRLNGGHTIQVADAIVRHEGSGTSGRHSDFTIYYGNRNKLWLIYKNMPSLIYWTTLPLQILGNIALLAKASSQGRMRAYLRAMRDGIIGLPRFAEDRKKIAESRQISTRDLAKFLTWSPLAPWTRPSIGQPLLKSKTTQA
ncbi:MAG: glycosyltransferase family 2 protein [Pseudomonadota bacterium]